MVKGYILQQVRENAEVIGGILKLRMLYTVFADGELRLPSFEANSPYG